MSFKEDFLRNHSSPKVHAVDVGGERVFVRELTAGERTKFDLMLDAKRNPKGLERFREKLIVLAMCHEDGKPLFDESDLDAVSRIRSSVLDPIIEKIREVNRMNAEPVEAVKKNCEMTPVAD